MYFTPIIFYLLKLSTIGISMTIAFNRFAQKQWLVFVLNQDGSLLSCGYNQYGQLGIGGIDKAGGQEKVPLRVLQVNFPFPSPISSISCGFAHTIVLLCDDGKLFGWGLNRQYQLGVGHSDNIHTPTLIDIWGKFSFISMFTNIRMFNIESNQNIMWL